MGRDGLRANLPLIFELPYSLFLAETLLDRPDLLKRSDVPSSAISKVATFPPVLELGAGTGFLSIFLSQIGCSRVWSSDVGDEDDDGQNTQPSTGREGTPGAEQRQLKLASGTRRRGPLDGLTANLELSETRAVYQSRREPC